MDRKHFLELCQINAVSPYTVIVLYSGIECYPKALKIWFNSAGETQNTAVLIEKKTRCVIECRTSEIKSLDKEQ